MQPIEYIQQLPTNGKKELAKKIGVSKSMITHIGNGHAPVPLAKIDSFVASSDGAVTREEVIDSILNRKKGACHG